jgi:thermitase
MKKITLFLIFIFAISCSRKVIVTQPNKNADPKFQKIEVVQGDDVLSNSQWALNNLGMKQTWEKFNSSKAVTIMMMGTGVDYNHEDLQGNILYRELEKNGKKVYEVGYDFVDDDSLAYDHFGHDTQLAGVMAAIHNNGKGIKGILKKANILPVRYIDRNGMSNIASFNRAIEYAVKKQPDILLINWANIAFSRDAKTQKIELLAVSKNLKKLAKFKIPVIIGAGNSSKEFGQKGLSKLMTQLENVLVITSINEKNQKPWLANYSHRFVHTSAPGEKIMTTVKGNQYLSVDGTSLAAAHVAGAFAYAISEFKGKLSILDFKQALMSFEASNSIQNDNNTLGRNSLNIFKFLTYLEK